MASSSGNSSDAMDAPLSIHVLPPAVPFHASAPSHTIIFLRERAHSVHDLMDKFILFPDAQSNSLTESFPTVRWVFPGPLVRPGEPACRWFKDAGDDGSDNEEEHAQSLRRCAASVCKLIHREAYHLGGRYDRIILAGIGQGAATAIHAFLNLNTPAMPGDTSSSPVPRRIGAFMAFGGRLLFSGQSLAEMRALLQVQGAPGGEDSEVIRNTPVLLEHCDDNEHVPIADGRALCGFLAKIGASVVLREYVGGGRWFNSPHGVEDAIAFLGQTLDLQRRSVRNRAPERKREGTDGKGQE